MQLRRGHTHCPREWCASLHVGDMLLRPFLRSSLEDVTFRYLPPSGHPCLAEPVTGTRLKVLQRLQDALKEGALASTLGRCYLAAL
eukprot:s3046_g12.t1